MSSPVTLSNYIAGAYVAPSSNSFLDVTNPATNEVIAKAPVSNLADVESAVRAASAAFPAWSGLTFKARAAVMFKFHRLIQEHADELAELIVKEHGKNKPEALAEVAKGNETVEWACSMPQVAMGRIQEVSRGVTCHDGLEALGVVGCIVPFNFPFMVPMWTIPIALACGNTVILKPSEKVPITMHRVAELFAQAGLPAGAFNIVNGTVDVVNAFCDHPEIKAVSFVGSSKVAEIVSKRGRNNNKRVLALGGAKNHLVALADADVEMTANDIVASFTGCSGQRCMAASALLPVGNQPQLIAKIVEKAGKIAAGQASGQVGPVIDEMARDRILKYIDEAEASGAQILLDGRSWARLDAAVPADDLRRRGNWVGPTVILHSRPTDPALQDEIFGPVISILPVTSHEEAIAIENGNPYGNAACIYTSVGAHAEWFTRRFRAGMIGVNVGVPVPREPFSFGGWYASRFGDLDITGEGAMNFFTQRRKVTTKWVAPAEKNWMN
eukprot:GILI01003611.1.p1 GENE.GILI01003611.1~~GILI01003611.1.p1  ORF type:complete len:498 (+),score=155.97 GILI01003611.1:69-1562(+)